MATRTACSVLDSCFDFSLFNSRVGQDGSRATHWIREMVSGLCFKIGHPVYPAVALQSGLMGSVSAEFSVDQSGNATSIVLNGSAPFEGTVRAAIGGSKLPTACVGRKVEVAFSFQTKPNLSRASSRIGLLFPLAEPPVDLRGRERAMCSYNTVALIASEGSAHNRVRLLADPMASGRCRTSRKSRRGV